MVANPEKFQILLLKPKNKNIEHFKIQIQDKVLQNTQTVKLLGVTIDQNLTFKNHITILCTSAKNKLKALRWISTCPFIDRNGKSGQDIQEKTIST